MLNQLKKIRRASEHRVLHPLWNLPFPTQEPFQVHNANPGLLDGLPVVYGKQKTKVKPWLAKKKQQNLKPESTYVYFSKIVFNSLFLFSKLSPRKYPRNNTRCLKGTYNLLRALFKEKKCFKGFLVKEVKGGSIVTACGHTSFMPKSHSAGLAQPGPEEWIMGFKTITRRRRMRARAFLTSLNIVTSSKPLNKRVADEQAKSFRLEKGQPFRRSGARWQPLVRALNSKLDLEAYALRKKARSQARAKRKTGGAAKKD